VPPSAGAAAATIPVNNAVTPATKMPFRVTAVVMATPTMLLKDGLA
jgi:hypothetical protein